ncbi:MAG: sigma 54-interacting transcriptional regulator [Myxococcota bacterium]|nr:sigma 54-interacting transcriptional regulator [Myxococcota bacterium]
MVLSDVPTTRSAASKCPARDVPVYVVTVVEGPDRGKSIQLDASSAGRVLVGQSRSCELHLTDGQVSRRHLALEATGRGLRVTDLGSTNGTRSESVAVVDAYFAGGERILIGESTLRLAVAPPRGPISLANATRFGRVFGGSDAMRKLYTLCERLAASSVPVVIEGETGTGKELLAESLHEEGPRAEGPFVVFDCTAVSPSLVESTLFGHERGAFTNAFAPRKGVFELAHGGTLLIDEVGELELALQPKLLRALERGEVQRVGGEKWTRVDVRVQAATRRDLDAEVQAGRFREDLYYRLAVGRIELPPLRDRHGDVGLLARHFWRKLDAADQVFPAELAARLDAYRWPGNVRELRNAIARRLALGDVALGPRSSRSESRAEAAGSVPAASLDDVLGRVLETDLPLSLARQQVVDEFERRYVDRVLAKHGGNVTRAAQASGIARRHFHTLRARHGV